MMNKKKALELIDKQRQRIESLKSLSCSSQEFIDWREETAVVVKLIFGITSDYYKRLNNLSFYPMGLATRIIENRRPSPTEPEIKETYLNSLRRCETMMKVMVIEIETWECDDLEYPQNAIEIVQKICARFHQVARQIRQRHDSRITICVNDEYDVQDLLHALLRLHFDDVRAEEWTPSYAGSSSRMDFLLKEDRLVIEVKKTRKGLGAKEVGEQLMIDIERYTAHPDCGTLICFVYDPDGKVANPVGIENDLNRETEKLKVITIITPK